MFAFYLVLGVAVAAIFEEGYRRGAIKRNPEAGGWALALRVLLWPRVLWRNRALLAALVRGDQIHWDGET